MKKVKIAPTNSGYQKVIEGTIIRETKTMWVVSIPIPSGIYNTQTWKFSKKDHLRVGSYKEEFPRYKIQF